MLVQLDRVNSPSSRMSTHELVVQIKCLRNCLLISNSTIFHPLGFLACLQLLLSYKIWCSWSIAGGGRGFNIFNAIRCSAGRHDSSWTKQPWQTCWDKYRREEKWRQMLFAHIYRLRSFSFQDYFLQSSGNLLNDNIIFTQSLMVECVWAFSFKGGKWIIFNLIFLRTSQFSAVFQDVTVSPDSFIPTDNRMTNPSNSNVSSIIW